jgi:hypothetical protein
MRCVTRWAALLAVGLATLAVAPPSAHARPRIDWVRVDVPERDDAARVTKLFKQLLGQAAKKANFGKAKNVALSARIMELTVEQHGDVLHVNCTAMGRVAGGAGARSRISFGGSPEKRDELEKEVLTMVANGLVARLAQIVRTKAAKAAAR